MKKSKLMFFLTATGLSLSLNAGTLPTVWRVNPITGVTTPLMVDSTTVTGLAADRRDTPTPGRLRQRYA